MIEGLINFTYNTNINKILDITLYNNDELIKTIEDIHYYERGEWKNNETKRTDYVIMNFKKDAIPSELKTIISLFIDKDNRIQSKYKVKIIEKTDNLVKIKTSIKLINKLANLIFKLLRFKIKINISYNPDNNQTSVEVIYKIKTSLPSTYNKYINDLLENTIKPHYIFKIDEFVKSSVISLE
jgi:hypothetical protein